MYWFIIEPPFGSCPMYFHWLWIEQKSEGQGLWPSPNGSSLDVSPKRQRWRRPSMKAFGKSGHRPTSSTSESRKSGNPCWECLFFKTSYSEVLPESRLGYIEASILKIVYTLVEKTVNLCKAVWLKRSRELWEPSGDMSSPWFQNTDKATVWSYEMGWGVKTYKIILLGNPHQANLFDQKYVWFILETCNSQPW